MQKKIYAYTRVYFNLIPQKSAQEAIQELNFNVEPPITWVQISNSLYFIPTQLLRVSYVQKTQL